MTLPGSFWRNPLAVLEQDERLKRREKEGCSACRHCKSMAWNRMLECARKQWPGYRGFCPQWEEAHDHAG